MEIDLVTQNNQYENVFRFDYDSQKMNDNINLLKWKKSILKKNNNDRNLKLFKCQEDKIFFYNSNKDNYLGLCPICGKNICYFCLFPYKDNKKSDIICCLKRLFHVCFFINGPNYIKRNNVFTSFAICFLIPGFNIFMGGNYLTLIINDIANQKKKKINHVLESQFYEEKYYFIFPLFMYFVLVIPFFFLNAFFILGLILISIPFKFIPLKYYLGVFDIKDDSFS